MINFFHIHCRHDRTATPFIVVKRSACNGNPVCMEKHTGTRCDIFKIYFGIGDMIICEKRFFIKFVPCKDEQIFVTDNRIESVFSIENKRLFK